MGQAVKASKRRTREHARARASCRQPRRHVARGARAPASSSFGDRSRRRSCHTTPKLNDECARAHEYCIRCCFNWPRIASILLPIADARVRVHIPRRTPSWRARVWLASAFFLCLFVSSCACVCSSSRENCDIGLAHAQHAGLAGLTKIHSLALWSSVRSSQ